MFYHYLLCIKRGWFISSLVCLLLKGRTLFFEYICILYNNLEYKNTSLHYCASSLDEGYSPYNTAYLWHINDLLIWLGKKQNQWSMNAGSKKQKEAFVIVSHTTYLTRESCTCMNENLFSPYKRCNECIRVIPVAIVFSLLKNGWGKINNYAHKYHHQIEDPLKYEQIEYANDFCFFLSTI